MAVGPDCWPDMKPVRGFRLGTAMAGIKTPGRRDLVVMNWDQAATVAGVFTLNRFCAAPVRLAKARLTRDCLKSAPQYFLINTGNANAGTGQQGLADAEAITRALADHCNVAESSVLPFSTGVIGEPLPVDKIVQGIPEACSQLSEHGWREAGEGILTTDTRPKGSCRQFTVADVTYTVTGISKGSGMIKPNMATMLAYVATDIAIEQPLLQKILTDAANLSFNRITVDGDTSTNDSFMLVATGAAGNTALTMPEGELYKAACKAIQQVSMELAQAIVRDGEGATKFITVEVEKAVSVVDALEVAYTVAHSPLVKTALFANDPNWGRILAAVGRADLKELDMEKVSIWLDDLCLIQNGEPAQGYTEEAGQAVMDQSDIRIRIALGAGEVSEQLWTTDLSHEYVRINAEYRS